MNLDDFQRELQSRFDEFNQAIATDKGDWVVKGFIDVYRNIYTITVDTKVVSKIIELLLFPVISEFASQRGFKVVLSEHQNHYPDISFIAPDETKIALDVKSTYRTSPTRASGMTLGAFTGYFRQRSSTKNVTFPYSSYARHLVLGIIYSRTEDIVVQRQVYTLDHLQDIVSVVRDFAFLLREKWRIAADRPGSGNTKNIGSVTDIRSLIDGRGAFHSLGEQVFDDYWMNYLTNDMAQAIDSEVPYRNLDEYSRWKKRGVR